MFQLLLCNNCNVKLVKKLLEEGFKIPVYQNEYQKKLESRDLDNNNLTRFSLDDSFQGVRRLFVVAFNDTNGGDKKVERNTQSIFFQE